MRIWFFFRLKNFFENNRFFGNDIDKSACFKAKDFFPFSRVFNLNLFSNYNRECFDIKDNEKLIVVGNPPYNDTTSQIRQEIKSSQDQKINISNLASSYYSSTADSFEYDTLRIYHYGFFKDKDWCSILV